MTYAINERIDTHAARLGVSAETLIQVAEPFRRDIEARCDVVAADHESWGRLSCHAKSAWVANSWLPAVHGLDRAPIIELGKAARPNLPTAKVAEILVEVVLQTRVSEPGAHAA